jgi:hypothetical protein
MGGRLGSVDDDVSCVAGWMNPRWVRATVNLSACVIAPAATSS